MLPSSSGYSAPHLPSGLYFPLLVNVWTGAGLKTGEAATGAGAGAGAGLLPPVDTMSK